jgi:hypothetical protein
MAGSAVKFTIGPDVLKVDLSPLARYLDADPVTRSYFLAPEREHYKLIAYLAAQCPSSFRILDIGTATGASALAASIVGNPVVSYDTMGRPLFEVTTRPNIKFVKAMDPYLHVSHMASGKPPCRMAILDVDPHDGIKEARYLQAFESSGFHGGIVLCDDIAVNDAMKAWWESIEQPKYDVTKYGHFTGSGIVSFGAQVEVL